MGRAPGAPAAALLRLLGCVLVVAAVACGDAEESSEPLLLERLAFVPAAACRVAQVVDCSTDDDLLVGRFEVTRSEWIAARRGPEGEIFALPEVFQSDWGADSERWPATGMTLGQAQAYAARLGMRLPTFAEWMRCAAGSRAQYWPWGTRRQDSAANTLELGLFRPAPVGTFQNGQTFAGLHDMLGNVWEWVDRPPPPGSFLASSFSGAPIATHTGTWAMGGSCLTRARPLYWTREGLHLFARQIDPEHRGSDLGLRVVAEAREFLWRGARSWSRTAVRARVEKVGESWGRSSVALLDELAGREGAAPALEWLLAGARR